MKAFITGGAGFIGSHLAGSLLRREDVESVVVYDNFSSGTRGHLAHLGHEPRLAIVEGDIKHLGALSLAMRGATTVYHLAANPDIAKAVRFPDIDFWEGTYLAHNVLEAMRLNGVGRIFYTSGSGVYGEAAGVEFAESFGPCLPISTYGASKLACEALISSYCHMFGMTGRAFRFANVVGPRQTHGVGFDFLRKLRDDSRRLRILGDGTQRKSYIYVDDVLAAIELVEKQSGAGGAFDVFNVATDDYVTVTEIARMACEVAGLVPRDVEFEYTGGDRGWKGDVPQVLFDVTKLKARGWRCTRTSSAALEASMEAMWNERATAR